MTNVVTLHGDPLATPGNPDKDLVEFLEQILEDAKAGTITGICLVAERNDDMTVTGKGGAFAVFSMVGGLHQLIHDLVKSYDKFS